MTYRTMVFAILLPIGSCPTFADLNAKSTAGSQIGTDSHTTAPNLVRKAKQGDGNAKVYVDPASDTGRL